MELQIKSKVDEMRRYRESTSISQSLLTSLSRGPGTLQAARKDTTYFTLGSLVDTLAFFGEDGFNELYHISKVKQPTDTMWEYHKLLLDCVILGKTMEEAKEIAYAQSGIKLSRTTVESRYITEVIPYLEEMELHKGRDLVTRKDVQQAKALVKALHTDKYTSKYFNSSNDYQVVIQGVINNLPCKGLIDILEIDEVNKTMRVVDLKTTSKPILNFYKSILSYRYDLQLAFYTELLKQSDMSKGYKILNPRLIVINTANLEPPLVFELSEQDMDVARNGGTAYDGAEVKGYLQLLDDYAYITSSGEMYYKDYVDNGGVKRLNLYGRNLEVR